MVPVPLRKFVWHAAPITLSHLWLALTVYLFRLDISLPFAALSAAGGGVRRRRVGAEDKGPAFRQFKVVLWRQDTPNNSKATESLNPASDYKKQETRNIVLFAFKGVAK